MPSRSATIPNPPTTAYSPPHGSPAPPADAASVSGIPHTRQPLDASTVARAAVSREVIIDILTRARFAPSGDNTQPWRFEITSQNQLVIHGRDTRHDCVYDLRGHASLIAIGALLETIAVAASMHQLRVTFIRRTEMPDDQPTFDARFTPDDSVAGDPLNAVIEERVTQRRPLRSTPLTAAQIDALTAALPPGYRVIFHQSFAQRRRLAWLLFQSAHIRLTTREAFETHRKVIQWNAVTSDDRIPDQAVGVDPMTRRLMRWAMGSWSRITFLNRFMAGTIAPRLQLDFLPALGCAGHFFLVADAPPKSMDDFIAAGRALQRFWLAATAQKLLLQPEMTPLIFAQYDRQGLRFSESQPAIARAGKIRAKLETLLTTEVCERTLFMGRLGTGRTPTSRSLRLPMDQLMHAPPASAGED